MKTKQILSYFLQPFLIASFPIIRIYLFNITNIPFLHLVFSAITIFTISSVIYILLSLIYKNLKKGSFITSLLFFIFFSVDIIVRNIIKPILEKLDWKIITFPHAKYLLIIGLVFFIILANKIYKTKLLNRLFKKIVLPFLVLLYLSTIVTIIIKTYNHHESIQPYNRWNENFRKSLSQKASILKKNLNTKEMPDIYFIILDSYSSNTHLLKYYGFDNSRFTKQLKNIGFKVIENSLSNYSCTEYSLPATLNMNYLPNHILPLPTRHMWQDNNISFFLKKLGYTIIDLGQNSFRENTINSSQVYLTPKKRSLIKQLKTELQEFFCGHFSIVYNFIKWNTITSIFMEKINQDSNTFQRKIITTKLDILEKTPLLSSPKFVHAHFMCPHPPHLFDEKGKPFCPQKSILSEKKQFIQSTKFINKQIINTIKKIITTSTKQPVIILQADHSGYNTLFNTYKDVLNKMQTDPRIPFEILSAYILPINKNIKIPLNITPVNNFRFILNALFNTDFKLLENKHFFSTEKISTLKEITLNKPTEKKSVTNEN